MSHCHQHAECQNEKHNPPIISLCKFQSPTARREQSTNAGVAFLRMAMRIRTVHTLTCGTIYLLFHSLLFGGVVPFLFVVCLCLRLRSFVSP